MFPDNPSYAGGMGLRRYVAKFFAPNWDVWKKTEAAFPGAYQAIVGTPKLDNWMHYGPIKATKPHTIGISFHWDGKDVKPEAGNAFHYYKESLKELGKHYHVLGHGHPRIIDELAPYWQECGFEIVRRFEDVMERVEVYVNDCSSTLYEFLVTGRPVIILNTPEFNRKVHYGIRFWDYTNIGPWVNRPEELLPTIQLMLNHDEYKAERALARDTLYPYLGHSAELAAKEIRSFVDQVNLTYR